MTDLSNTRPAPVQGSHWEGRCIIDHGGTEVRVVHIAGGSVLRVEPAGDDAFVPNVLAVIRQAGRDAVWEAALALVQRANADPRLRAQIVGLEHAVTMAVEPIL